MSEQSNNGTEHPFDEATIGDEVKIQVCGRLLTAKIISVCKVDTEND